MDQNQPSPTRRKVKFAPRSTPTRKSKPATTKTEARDEDDGESAQAQALLRRLNENLARRGPKTEKKLIHGENYLFDPFGVEAVNKEFGAGFNANVQVAFGPGASSESSLRTYSNSKRVNGGKSSGSASKVSESGQDVLTFPATAREDENDTCIIDASDADTGASTGKVKKEYKEPWDYHSYYPTSLPLRKPNSGDPEILDEEEFGEAATSIEYDENTVNSAAELGLLDESEQKRMLLFQLPPLPLVKQPVSRKGKEKVGASEASAKGSTMEDLSGGYVGKILVYKSGAVKLKLGETLYDVSPGSNCIFAQQVVAMNCAQKNCCVVGEPGKRAVVTPDVDSIEL